MLLCIENWESSRYDTNFVIIGNIMVTICFQCKLAQAKAYTPTVSFCNNNTILNIKHTS